MRVKPFCSDNSLESKNYANSAHPPAEQPNSTERKLRSQCNRLNGFADFFQTNIVGLTGNISFDDQGYRKNFSVDVVEMTTNSEMVKVAEWSDNLGLKLIPPKYKRVRLDNEFENKTYIVTSILVLLSVMLAKRICML